jgi:hypothetical protein
LLETIVFNLLCFQTFCRSKKYILTLVPIFVVGPALGFAIFLLRHKLLTLFKKCCGSSEVEEKDVSKVRTRNMARQIFLIVI